MADWQEAHWLLALSLLAIDWHGGGGGKCDRSLSTPCTSPASCYPTRSAADNMNENPQIPP